MTGDLTGSDDKQRLWSGRIAAWKDKRWQSQAGEPKNTEIGDKPKLYSS